MNSSFAGVGSGGEGQGGGAGQRRAEGPAQPQRHHGRPLRPSDICSEGHMCSMPTAAWGAAGCLPLNTFMHLLLAAASIRKEFVACLRPSCVIRACPLSGLSDLRQQQVFIVCLWKSGNTSGHARLDPECGMRNAGAARSAWHLQTPSKWCVLSVPTL